MAILMSLHKKWAHMILDGKKPFEFRKKIGKDWKAGDTVYIYETSKNGGSQKIVGKFVVKDVKAIQKCRLGCYSFLEYYCEHIIKDMEALAAVRTAYEKDVPGYNNSVKLTYLYLPEVLDSLINHKDLPYSYYDEEYQEKKEKGNALVEACDAWLSEIGFYDDYDESNYKYYIEVETPERFKEPLNLSDFKSREDKEITRPPQSWMYCK